MIFSVVVDLIIASQAIYSVHQQRPERFCPPMVLQNQRAYDAICNPGLKWVKNIVDEKSCDLISQSEQQQSSSSATNRKSDEWGLMQGEERLQVSRGKSLFNPLIFNLLCVKLRCNVLCTLY